MTIEPEAITSTGLPRAVRGYDTRATDELLKRVAWDYLQLQNTCRQLTAKLEQQGSSTSADKPAQQPRPPVVPRAETDDVARTLIAAAQQAAKELRRSAREECEIMLKKARARAQAIEALEKRRVERATVGAGQIQAAAAQLRARLQAALEAAIAEAGDPEDDRERSTAGSYVKD
jgi:cell division septum initiation protein DivIVA